MRLLSFSIAFALLATTWTVETYRILGLFPFNGASHFMMFERLMKELASRGHQVDVVSHFPLKKPFPNYNDILSLAGTLPSYRNNMSYEFGTTHLTEKSVVYSIATQFGGDLCELMNLPRFQKFIKNPPRDPPYDLLITEIFGSTCYLALGQYLKVPIVATITSPMWPWANEMVANPENPAYIPHVFSGLCGNLNFWQRIKNTITLFQAKWKFNYYTSYQEDKVKKYIGSDAPSIQDARNNVSLVLVNSHYSLHGIRPFTTNVVEVGGLHIVSSKEPLEHELQQWLDSSTSGFIYISFGSMLKIESFPKEILAAFYSSLAKLAPIRALVKVANKAELLPGLPSNVFTLPWIPQMAVLEHKNIRAFVTHGGLMGTQEAIYCGVPMVGLPIFGDQPQNIQLYVKKHIAVGLELSTLSEQTLDRAFNAVLHDPSYMQTSKKISMEFRDRPMTAADTAAFWVEYVIRHGGRNIRSPAMDLTWWQISLIDVFGTLLLAAMIAIYLLQYTLRRIVAVAFKSDVTVTSKLRKKK